jgi:hypothetical protein
MSDVLRALAALTTTSAVLVACSDKSIARDDFERSFTCPTDRLTVTGRNDLKPRDLAIRQEVPPKDIAADPERLALWKKTEASRTSEYDGNNVVQVQGCSHEVFYICGDLRVSVGATRHGCMRAPYPPNASGVSASASGAP